MNLNIEATFRSVGTISVPCFLLFGLTDCNFRLLTHIFVVID